MAGYGYGVSPFGGPNKPAGYPLFVGWLNIASSQKLPKAGPPNRGRHSFPYQSGVELRQIESSLSAV